MLVINIKVLLDLTLGLVEASMCDILGQMNKRGKIAELNALISASVGGRCECRPVTVQVFVFN